jgi:hypothetical protein
MIAERIPELRNLSSDQKIILAAELLSEALDAPTETPDPEIVRALNERLKSHESHPDEVSTWEQVRSLILERDRRS